MMKGLAALAMVALGQATPEMNRLPNGDTKIKHFVVLLMENRPIDHTFGCMAGEGIIDLEGINGTHQFPKDPDNETAGVENVTCGTANYVCEHGPPYSMWELKVKPGTDVDKYPYGEQDDKYSAQNGATGNALMMFNSTQLPIKTAVAKNFAVFNHLHGAIPSFSEPNHLMWATGTSCNLATNPIAGCTANASTFSQPTIFDSLNHSGVTYKMYSNSSNGACAAEAGLLGVARHKHACFDQGEFYKDAAAGTLPAYSFLSPPGEACDHPCHDIAKGERLLKDLYEALRAGPGWENTMFFVAYDDGGGFYDHVTPPSEGVPNPEQGCQVPDGCSGHPDFDFKRLGIRVTSYVISPWIPKNLAVQRPTGPKPTSQFDLTSNIATAKNLFDLPTFLTKRDAWAGSLTELLTLDKPRDDCPMHFPEGPPVAGPWTAPGTTNSESDLRRLAVMHEDAPQPQHCSAQRRTCEGTAAVTERQKRLIRKLAHMFPSSAPDMEDITYAEAEEWIEEYSGKWMELPAAPPLHPDAFMAATVSAR